MRVVVTGGGSRLGRVIAERLTSEHDVRLIERHSIIEPAGVETMEADIRDADGAAKAVRDMDTVVHTCEPPPGSSDDLALDFATRGTHALFQTAVEAGVKRFVVAGTLEVFTGYPDDVYISEMWKPLPPVEMRVLAKYLGEQTAREFAREYAVSVTGLRFGKLADEEEVAGSPRDLMWVDYRDAAQAVEKAVGLDRSGAGRSRHRWAVYHICADIANPKFLLQQAKQELGYAPVHGFQGTAQ